MRKILAIAVIAVRSAARSKVVLCLLALLLLTLFGLPLTLKGDGTPAGYVHLLLNYTLNMLFVLLTLTSLWAGCAAISTEIQDRQMHLLVTKPVRRAQIWAGKWLGLLAVNALLLTLAGIITYGMLRWQTRPARLSPQDQAVLANQILTARQAVSALPPQPPADLSAVIARLEKQSAAGQIHPEQLRAQAEDMVRLQRLSVAPGASRTFRFRVAHNRVGGRPLFLRLRLEASAPTASRVAGAWTAPAAPEFRVQREFKTGQPVWIEIPDDLPEASGLLELTFTHQDQEELTLLFNPQEPPQLFYTVGGFAMNFVRSLLILFFRLSLICAVGVTFGSLFTLPVAGCCSAWMLTLMFCRGFIQESAGQADAGSALVQRLAQLYFKALQLITLPFQGVDPLPLLATGRRVSWQLTLVDGLLQALIFSGLIAAVGIGLFNRKEIAGLNQG
jgi:hypothetical protein